MASAELKVVVECRTISLGQIM